MNLWLSSVILVVGMFMSSAALTAEQCRPLVNPYSTYKLKPNRWIFIIGYVTTGPYQTLFSDVQSMWVNFRPAENANEFYEDIGIRHTTYCKFATSQGIIFRNSGIIEKSNFSCTYHDLPTCDDCMLYHVSSVNNRNLVKVGTPKTIAEVPEYRALYLMAREEEVDDSDLAYFRKQAECLGFSGEPNFFYDPKYSLCEKDNNNKGKVEEHDD